LPIWHVTFINYVLSSQICWLVVSVILKELPSKTNFKWKFLYVIMCSKFFFRYMLETLVYLVDNFHLKIFVLNTSQIISVRNYLCLLTSVSEYQQNCRRHFFTTTGIIETCFRGSFIQGCRMVRCKWCRFPVYVLIKNHSLAPRQ